MPQPDRVVSILTAGLTIAIGSIGPALGEGRAAAQALQASRSSPTRRTPSPARCSSASR